MTNIKYAGKDFRQDLGLYVDSIESYGTPKKSYTFHEVLGRNGSLAVDDHRFEDHEETFSCYIRENFVPNFRNVQAFLNSLKGYQRLERSNEPDYFEMGLYEGEISARPTQLLQAGAFPFRLRLHPEKWLKSGETAVDAASTSETLEGNPVQFENHSGLTALTGLNVDIQPVQDLNGYEYPWIGGAGKNLFHVTREGRTNGGITYTADTSANVIHASGTATAASYAYSNGGWTWANSMLLKAGTYTASMTEVNGARFTIYEVLESGGVNNVPLVELTSSPATFTLTEDTHIGFQIRIENGTTVDDTLYIQIESGSTATAYEPYSNICPITGHTSATVTRTVDSSVTDYTIDLNGTRYGGTLDVSTGVLTVDTVSKTIGSFNWADRISAQNRVYATVAALFGEDNRPYVYSSEAEMFADGKNRCDKLQVSNTRQGTNNPSVTFGLINMYLYINGVTAISDEITDKATLNTWLDNNPLQITFRLATPTTVQLTPQQVSLLTGTNIISTDMNSLTVTISSPAELENPTLFESKPLIRVYGNGTLNVNDQYITVANSPYTYIDIDCELMDCYHGSNNANQYVSFSTTDYVTLRSGTNYFSYSGFTKVEVTPRWYEI